MQWPLYFTNTLRIILTWLFEEICNRFRVPMVFLTLISISSLEMVQFLSINHSTCNDMNYQNALDSLLSCEDHFSIQVIVSLDWHVHGASNTAGNRLCTLFFNWEGNVFDFVSVHLGQWYSVVLFFTFLVSVRTISTQ